MKTRKNLLLLLAILALFLLITGVSNSFAAQDNEEVPVSIMVRANWSGCDGDCDAKQSGNTVNSGGYTINITGAVKPGSGGGEFIGYEPTSLNGTCIVQYKENSLDKDCQKCNPIKTIRGTRTVAFGKDENAIAFMQGFLGTLGAGFAQQLSGELGPGYEKTLTSLPEQRIISFGATGPMTLTITTKDCTSCAPTTETAQAGFAIGINADMTTKKSSSASWKTNAHPMDSLGANVIDLGGQQKVGPERNQKGKAHYTVTWSLGEAQPAKLKLKEVHFNYDGNKDSGVPLIRHTDDKEIKAPEWTARGERKSAAFIRNKPFKVKALFGVEGKRVERAEIWAEEEIDEKQGEIEKGFEGLKRTMVEFAEGETEKEVEFTIESPQAAISVNNVRWCWKANIWYKGSEEPETDIEIKAEGPNAAGYSEHTIYIVGDKPIPLTTAYEFAVKKGCQWAEGKPGGDDAFMAIWSKFWNIECPEGSSCAMGMLAYAHDQSIVTTGDLLRAGQGKCGAWQKFFADVVGSQGIAVELITVKPKRETGLNTMVVWPRSAQGNDQPKRLFYDHAIVRYQGRFYDPSYHFDLAVSPGEALSLYENETFKAYCTDKESVTNTVCISKCVTANGDPDYDCMARECDCRRNYPLECEVTSK